MEEIQEVARERIARANSMRKGGEDVSVEDLHEALRETAKREEELEWVSEHLPARPSGVFVEAADAETVRASMIVVEYLDGNEMLYVLDRAWDDLGDEGGGGMSVKEALEIAVHRNASKGGMPDEEKALAHALACVKEAAEGGEPRKADVWKARERVVDDGCGRLFEDCFGRMEKDRSLGVLEALQEAANRGCVNPHHIQPLKLGNEALRIVDEACGMRLGLEKELWQEKGLSENLRKEDVEKVQAEIAERRKGRSPAAQRVAASESEGLSGLFSEETRLGRGRGSLER